MFTDSHGFVAMPVTSCIKDTCSNLSQSKLVKGDEIVRPCDRHSTETAKLRKHLTKYKKNTRKWMVESKKNFRLKIIGIRVFSVNFIQ